MWGKREGVEGNVAGKLRSKKNVSYRELTEEEINCVDEPIVIEPGVHASFGQLSPSNAMVRATGGGEGLAVTAEAQQDTSWSDGSDDEDWTDFSTDEELTSDSDHSDSDDEVPASAVKEECRECEDDSDGLACKEWSAISSFPLCTYNINGLSLNTRGRSRFIKANIKKLGHSYRGGIIMLQELKLEGNGQQTQDGVDAGYAAAFKHLLPGWKVFFSLDTSMHAGVATCICPTLLRLYDAKATDNLIDGDASLDLRELSRGRVLNVTLQPKPVEEGAPPPTVSVTNLYLPSGGAHGLVADVLNAVRENLPARQYNVVSGDFNFVLRAEDHSPSKKWERRSYYDISEKLQEAWNAFAERFSLTEVAQDQHTHHRIHMNDLAGSSTAKLDRIYTSHSQADQTVFEACGHICDIPYSVFSKFQLGEDGVLEKSKVKSSDHAPVGVFFIPTERPPNKVNRIPAWIVDREEFGRAFYKDWGSVAGHVHPELGLDLLKDRMFKAARLVARELKFRATVVTESHGKLAIAVALLRIATSVPLASDKLHSLTHRFPQLQRLVVDGAPDVAGIKGHINLLVSEAATVHVDAFAGEMMGRTFPLGDNMHDILSNPKVARPKGLAERLKVWLPSLRRRIRQLKDERSADQATTEATRDPQEMAKIAKRYWRRIWAKAPKHMRPRLKTFLGHARVMRRSLVPVIPDADTVADIIQGTNNSCAGPDGIPFNAYRVLVRAAAPVIHKLLLHFSMGGLPGCDYNKGLLFLLPKKDTMLAKDTRPISVTNCDNRILAKIVVHSITPALTDPRVGIHQDQKGGIAGRQGTEHVHGLSEKFYKAAEGGPTPYYLLFMDTKKAFDSIHHEFIFAVLEHFGMPVWVVRTIQALLHNVAVTPHFGTTTGVWIKIKRGVKQGCPLSPWIFAMCMDILVRKLKTFDGLDVYAYVDDIALGVIDFRLFAKCMKVIDLFSKASGLGINHDKTKGVCSQDDGRFSSWARSRHCPWHRDFEVVHEYVYLGFLTGKWVTAAGVYRVAFQKFRKRLSAYKVALRGLTPCRRFDVFNIFILPILSYLAPLYSLPSEGSVSHATAKNLVRKALVSYGGSAYGYQQLIAPSTGIGFGNPVKDVWSYTVAVMVAQTDLDVFKGVTNVPIRGKVSMQISRQWSDMAAEFVNWHLYVHTVEGRPFPSFDPDVYAKKTPAGRRRAIYDTMVQGSLKFHKKGKDTRKKLKARDLPYTDKTLKLLQENHALIKSNMPNHARYHQVAMIHNAVGTGTRSRHFTKASEHEMRCRACGQGNDSTRHLLGDNCVTEEARDKFGVCIKYNLNHTSLGGANSWHTAFLIFKGSDHHKEAVNAITIFNYAVWLAQVSYFRRSQSVPHRSAAVRVIVDIALQMWVKVRSCKWKEPTSLHGGTLTVTNRHFGSTSNRTAADKIRARAEAIRLISSMSADTAIGFTDGSAIPNPGPCGTGVVLYMPEHHHLITSTNLSSDATGDGIPSLRASLPVLGNAESGGPLAAYTGLLVEGKGSNNIAELWGPAMLIQLLEWYELSTGKNHTGPIAIFIDSQLTINICMYKARPKSNTKLAHTVRRIVDRRGRSNVIYMFWIAGHVDLEENELVDGCAKLGAKQAQQELGMNVELAIAGEQFLPPGQAPYSYHSLPP